MPKAVNSTARKNVRVHVSDFPNGCPKQPAQVKHLRVIAMTRARNGQIRDLSHACFQITRVVPIALITAVLVAFIGQGTNEGADFLL